MYSNLDSKILRRKYIKFMVLVLDYTGFGIGSATWWKIQLDQIKDTSYSHKIVLQYALYVCMH